MNKMLVMIELDPDESRAIIEVFGIARLDKFLPDLLGEEGAHEAMEAMIIICKEIKNLLPPFEIDYYSDLEEDFYSVNIDLTNSQVSNLLDLSNKILLEDVISWGYKRKISKELINAMWCLKQGLIRAARNIDPPFR
jgi:hypothetical protein